MNKIIYAGREIKSGEFVAKSFTVLAHDDGGVTIVPPLKRFDAQPFTGIKIIFDGALLPFKQVRAIRDDGTVAFAAKQAVKYFDGDLKKKDLMLSALGNLLVSYASLGGGSGFSPVVELAVAEIEKGVSDCGFSLKDCLKKLPLNYDYIRKLFKKEVGATPAEYLLKERMTLAGQLIAGEVSNRFSRFSISQVAEACGFSEPLYFSRVFKKYYGVPPTEYK